jgi:hypothetical protein
MVIRRWHAIITNGDKHCMVAYTLTVGRDMGVDIINALIANE